MIGFLERGPHPIGPGKALKTLFQSVGIRQKPYHCRCDDLADKMDILGPDRCESNVDSLSVELQASAREWRDGNAFIPVPPLFVVKNLILAACIISRRSLQKKE